MKNIKSIVKNYKTSIPALFILISVVLYYCNVIDKDQMQAGITAFTAAGLFGAKDNDKNDTEL